MYVCKTTTREVSFALLLYISIDILLLKLTTTASHFYMVYSSMQFCLFLGIVPVSNFLSNLKNISCDLKRNSLGPKGMHAVARALIQNNYITELLLCDNALQPEGSAYVAKLLLENFNITKIDISENGFGSIGAHNMARVIKENNSLQSMNLSENLLKDRDANILAEALKRNSGLRHLNLSRNKFSEDAGLYLGKLYSVVSVNDTKVFKSCTLIKEAYVTLKLV